jgi:hypothetical protein
MALAATSFRGGPRHSAGHHARADKRIQRLRKRDRDHDGLSDWTELKRTRTNPRRADTDGEGLSDGTEVRRTKTNPRRADSDGDGASDSAEIRAGTNPWDPSSFPASPSAAQPQSSAPSGEKPAPGEEPAAAVTAVWTAPNGAEVGMPTTLDGSESTGSPPLRCVWRFENASGSTVFQEQSGCTIEFVFESTGTKFVRLVVEDPQGQSDSNRQDFYVADSESPGPDTTPPETTIVSGPPSSTTATSASFSFTSSEAGSTFECKLDTAAFSPCSSPQAYSGLALGSHGFAVRATDAAGNTDPSPASQTWWVLEEGAPPPPDTTAPETSITAEPSSRTTSTSASFSFVSSESGSSFECSLDGAVFSACNSPRAYTSLSVGSHRFAVRAKDTAGNSDATPAEFSWAIEAETPPGGPGCSSAVTKAASASAIRSAVQADHDVCVTADVGNVDLSGLGSSPVVVSTENGSMGEIDLSDTSNLTIRGARFRSTSLWNSDGTTIEGSRIGGTATTRTSDILINVAVSPDVTIKSNELAWTLAGTDGNSGYGIRSPGNSQGNNERLRIEDNYIHNVAADGIQGFGKGTDVVVNGNRIDYVGQEAGSTEHSDGIQMIDHGSNFRLTNNWISHEGYFAEGQISGSSGTLYVHGGSTGTLLIENNLFSDSQGRVEICGLGTGGTSISNVTVRRNTFSNLGQAYNSFPGFEWDCDSGSNDVITRNIAVDPDGGFAQNGFSSAIVSPNLWGQPSSVTLDTQGSCTSANCNPAGEEPIGYRKPAAVSW